MTTSETDGPSRARRIGTAVAIGCLVFMVFGAGVMLIWPKTVQTAVNNVAPIGGPFTLSKAHNPVQDIYLRKVVGKENVVQGVAVKALADPARGCRM